MSILPQFWTSDTHEVTKGSPREVTIFFPQFWASDTHEVTKRLLGQLKNLHFTTVLSVRHARSDERVDRRSENLHFTTVLSVGHAQSDQRVARPAQDFAFYHMLFNHNFERPTRTKWRKGRSAKWKICILPQIWASDTHEVTRWLSNPQCDPCAQDRKRIYFKRF